jgi:hypothetical protein
MSACKKIQNIFNFKIDQFDYERKDFFTMKFTKIDKILFCLSSSLQFLKTVLNSFERF